MTTRRAARPRRGAARDDDGRRDLAAAGSRSRAAWSTRSAGRATSPEADETLSARGCLVTPGLINTHHHMFQNLTRVFGPGLKRELLDWAGALGDMWVRMDEEASYVSTWIGLAELALGGCTQTTDDMYAHPRPKLIDAQIAAARDVGLRFDPCRGAVALGAGRRRDLPRRAGAGRRRRSSPTPNG